MVRPINRHFFFFINISFAKELISVIQFIVFTQIIFIYKILFIFMGRPEIYHIDQKISLEKLDWLIKIEKNTKVQPKLYFIRFRYLGDSIEEATSRLGVTKRIGYYWQSQWNENGYEGLLHKSGAGRPIYLSDKEILELKAMLESKYFWTTAMKLK